MIRNVLAFGIAIAICMLTTESVEAQLGSRFVNRALGGDGAIGGIDIDGRVQPSQRLIRPRSTVRNAAKDRFSPHSVYAYSNPGLTAGHVHAWNQNEQNVYAWHGGHQNWRWGTPTALVVPPTAAYGTSYAWGVGQVRSTPIHHQFGRGGAAMLGGSGEGAFQNTPYWPHSTDQFGIYPVRAPW
jgi:hypothetical protein